MSSGAASSTMAAILPFAAFAALAMSAVVLFVARGGANLCGSSLFSMASKKKDVEHWQKHVMFALTLTLKRYRFNSNPTATHNSTQLLDLTMGGSPQDSVSNVDLASSRRQRLPPAIAVRFQFTFLQWTCRGLPGLSVLVYSVEISLRTSSCAKLFLA